MLKYCSTLITLGFLLVVHLGYSQNFLNGDFENNTNTFDQLGLTNAQFNLMMENTNAFGTLGNMDVLTTNTWLSSGPQSGDWFIGLTGGGTDRLTLELDEPFLAGLSYTVRFYDSKYITIPTSLLSIGVSNAENDLGTEVYVTPTLPVDAEWTERTFSFVAPANSTYLTIEHVGGSGADWVAIDNFEVLCESSVDLGPDITACEGTEITLSAGIEGGVYEWQDGSTDSTFVVTESGFYTVNVDVEGCSVFEAIGITLIPFPEVTIDPEWSACEGETVTLSLSTDVFFPEYLWSDNSTNATLEVDEDGIYSVEVLNGGVCATTVSTEVNFVSYPIVDLGEDFTICSNSSQVLSAGNNNYAYLWQDGSQSSEILVSQAGVYSVIVSDGDCSSTDEVEVFEEFCEATLEIPNIYTPNENEFNENFQPIERINVASWKFKIFNRWGELVFETEDLDTFWKGENINGDKVPSGTYYYAISYVDKAAKNFDLSGYVMVIAD